MESHLLSFDLTMNLFLKNFKQFDKSVRLNLATLVQSIPGSYRATLAARASFLCQIKNMTCSNAHKYNMYRAHGQHYHALDRRRI